MYVLWKYVKDKIFVLRLDVSKAELKEPIITTITIQDSDILNHKLWYQNSCVKNHAHSIHNRSYANVSREIWKNCRCFCYRYRKISYICYYFIVHWKRLLYFFMNHLACKFRKAFRIRWPNQRDWKSYILIFATIKSL